MENLTILEEAERLKALFAGVNRAEFARKNKIAGGASYIYQHITARRPLNLDAALAYAKGLNVHLSEISPRLADEIANANKHIHNSQAPYYLEIEKVIELMEGTDDRGRLKCLLAIEDALSMHFAVTEKSKTKINNYDQTSEIEKAILDNFRLATKEGKELIINATKGVSKEEGKAKKAS